MTDPFKVTATASDAELITAARSPDATAYGILYERHAEAARRLARQIVRHPADVDDVVAESFARVLSAIRRGSGPSEAFRPYLLTTVRRVAFGQLRGQRRQIPTDGAEIPDLGEPFIDPAVASLERSLVTRAFKSLPERWSAVLWHTEIEQARPAEVALLLGITPNGVAALSYRAREGLRQAYLQLHLSSLARAECQPVAGQLGAHVRGGLSARDARRVDTHLRGCGDCKAAHAELASINGSLRGILAPAILGRQAAAYLAGTGHPSALTAMTGAIPRWAHGIRVLAMHRPIVPAAALAAAGIIVPTTTLVYPHLAAPRTAGPLAIGQARAASRSAGPGSTAPSRPGSVSPGDGGVPPALPSPAPSGQPTPGVPPSPSASPSGTPEPSPTVSTSPSASPSPRPTGNGPEAGLTVTVTVNGPLNLGVVVVVAIRVRDPGTAATAGLTADLTLPAGITLLGMQGRSPAWTCTTGSGTASCTHDPIGAGAAANVSFRALVTSLAGCGDPALATVTSGTLSASGQSAATVRCGRRR